MCPKVAKCLEATLHFFFLLQVSISFSPRSSPVSECYSYLHKEPKSQQTEIIGMERKRGLGCFLLESLVGASFASCTVL